jgi:prevent-host-death family protein
MKKASIRDLHIRTSELVREAADGAVIVIESRGKPVAELRPFSKQNQTPQLPKLDELWDRMPKCPTDSGRILEEEH